MSASRLRGDGVIFVLGMPRSGTTWLAKILDSHPNVLYRHEPDIVHQGWDTVPWICPGDKIAEYTEPTRRYLDQLVAVRTLKSAGPPPHFPKIYRSEAARWLRRSLVMALRGAELAFGTSRWPGRMAIPDFISPSPAGGVRIVVKSVSSLLRARLFAEVWPDSRMVVIIRHPCGQVASVKRGIELGKFRDDPEVLNEISRSPEMAALALTEPGPTGLVERLAWLWAIFNQRMLDNLDGVNCAKIVRYEDLAADPIGSAREIFDFVGLSWQAQTEDYIKSSTASDVDGGYFGLIRDPAAAATAWHRLLSAGDQRRILAIAQQVAIGSAFIGVF